MPNKLISTNLTRCGVGFPDYWRELIVLDGDTREIMHGLIEVDTEAGWIKRHAAYMPESMWMHELPVIQENRRCVVMRIADVEDPNHNPGDEDVS